MKYGLMVVAALLALMFASPAQALTQDEAQQMVRSVGCTADVIVQDSYDFNAFYAPPYHVIVLMGFDKLPESWQRLILWHETGHCLQFQNGSWPRLEGRHELEWDADAFAIRQLANEGIDGADLNEGVWAALYQQFGYRGDDYDSHGTSVDRITRGNLNRVIKRIES